MSFMAKGFRKTSTDVPTAMKSGAGRLHDCIEGDMNMDGNAKILNHVHIKILLCALAMALLAGYGIMKMGAVRLQNKIYRVI